MFPCQDTPSIKATYVAKVHVPDAMVPVMSAILVRHDKDNSTYEFKQDIPIPVFMLHIYIYRYIYAIICDAFYLGVSCCFGHW